MRRIGLLSAAIVALTSSAMSQTEPGVIEPITRQGGRIIYAFKPEANTVQCSTVSARETTPLKAPRLGRTILAEALVYSESSVGYVFLISYANGPHEVYFSTYTKRECTLDEAQSHGRVFVGDDRFNQAKSYYHNLFIELSE